MPRSAPIAPPTAPGQPSGPAAPLPVLRGSSAFRAWLRERCNASSVKQVAAGAGCNPAYLSNVLNGRSSIGPAFAARFGYSLRKVSLFVPAGPTGAPDPLTPPAQP